MVSIMANLIPTSISDNTQISSIKTSPIETKNLSSSRISDTVVASDKLVFDTTAEVIRADGINMVVAFQFYYRHYEGIQDVIKNSDASATRKLRMPLIKTYSMRKRGKNTDKDTFQYYFDPREVVTIFPSKLKTITYNIDEETLILESIDSLSPLHDKGSINNDNNMDLSKITIRYKADEPGNVSRTWWIHGASQVATAFQKWYSFVNRRNNDNKKGICLDTVINTQPGPSRLRLKKLMHLSTDTTNFIIHDTTGVNNNITTTNTTDPSTTVHEDNKLVTMMDTIHIDKISQIQSKNDNFINPPSIRKTSVTTTNNNTTTLIDNYEIFPSPSSLVVKNEAISSVPAIEQSTESTESYNKNTGGNPPLPYFSNSSITKNVSSSYNRPKMNRRPYAGGNRRTTTNTIKNTYHSNGTKTNATIISNELRHHNIEQEQEQEQEQQQQQQQQKQLHINSPTKVENFHGSSMGNNHVKNKCDNYTPNVNYQYNYGYPTTMVNNNTSVSSTSTPSYDGRNYGQSETVIYNMEIPVSWNISSNITQTIETPSYPSYNSFIYTPDTTNNNMMMVPMNNNNNHHYNNDNTTNVSFYRYITTGTTDSERKSAGVMLVPQNMLVNVPTSSNTTFSNFSNMYTVPSYPTMNYNYLPYPQTTNSTGGGWVSSTIPGRISTPNNTSHPGYSVPYYETYTPVTPNPPTTGEKNFRV